LGSYELACQHRATLSPEVEAALQSAEIDSKEIALCRAGNSRWLGSNYLRRHTVRDGTFLFLRGLELLGKWGQNVPKSKVHQFWVFGKEIAPKLRAEGL
jgi:hypothetical protein